MAVLIIHKSRFIALAGKPADAKINSQKTWIK